ncbi:MAG: hypothetical protein BWK78_00305 [Thiotrichaceae bacterium IS1]|nr:MAG: hypothetical protein BWK78_00305 [Thiotrichaceae bacterium IS1]
MTNLLESEDFDDPEEDKAMSSRNHAIVQGRLAGYFYFMVRNFSAPTELSLDMTLPNRQKLLKKYDAHTTRELKPAVAIFYAKDFGFLKRAKGPDPKRVKEVPLAVFEIISPSQSSWEILNKFNVYFDLGVKSCWMIDPNVTGIWVYHGIENFNYFSLTGEVVDDILKVRIPLDVIFCENQN